MNDRVQAPCGALGELLDGRGVVLADGATGTGYFAMGLTAGDAPELWNSDHPQRVATLHRAFIDAGSDVILTNTFGANACRLALHRAESRVAELNALAVRIARAEAARAGRPVLVAGSMGPSGELLEPVGKLSRADALAVFSAQAEALAGAGADLLWIETMSALDEVEMALQAAAGTGLPVVCTMSFDTNGSTMMGVTPALAAERLPALGPALCGCGSNCGVGAAEVVAGMLAMRRAAPDALLVAKANCGIPHWQDGAVRYDGTPRLMADYACLVRAAGARVIGGCCGTTPEHVAAMRAALDAPAAALPPTVEDIENRLGPVSAGLKAVLAGEAPALPAARRGGRRRRP